MSKKSLFTTLMVAIASSAMAQANFWNLNGVYMDTRTGGPGTLSSTSMPHYLFESDASSFAIPALCETYCNLSLDAPGVPLTSLQLNHITEGYSPSIPGFTSGEKTIMTSVAGREASYTAGQLKSDGTRDVYARSANTVYYVCTVMPNGSTTGSVTAIYTPPGASGIEFDFWTQIEISSDGLYLLLVGKDAKYLTVIEIATGTATIYNAPGGTHSRVQGFEYAKWATPGRQTRIYISHNSKNAANPTGTGGIGYYVLGNPINFYTVTPPSLVPDGDFGFTEIEKGKDGKVYLARNASGNYDFSAAGTVYSLDYFGGWIATSFTVPAADITTYSATSDRYYIQTQIDGENYDAGYYAAPTVSAGSVRLQNVTGSFTPASVPTVYRCGSDPIILKWNTNYGSLLKEYTIKVTSGSVTSGVFTPDALGSVSHTGTSSSQFNELQLMPFSFVPASFIGTDWKVEVTPRGACSTGATNVTYFKVRAVDILANYNAFRAIGGSITNNNKPLQETLPISSSMPTGASLAAFKTAVHETTGWQGATSAGITNINTNSGWVLRVYETDGTTGDRQIVSGTPAPDVTYKTGLMCTGGCDLKFGDYSKKFDASMAPYYLDASTNFDDGWYYFVDYYLWAKSAGAAELAAFSAKTWCAEFSVTLDGCTKVKRSFFKIASTSFPNGHTARLLPGDEDMNPTIVFPNPARNTLNISWNIQKEEGYTARIKLLDVMGKEVLSREWTEHPGTNVQTVGIERLAPGIYYYQLQISTGITTGKLVKE